MNPQESLNSPPPSTQQAWTPPPQPSGPARKKVSAKLIAFIIVGVLLVVLAVIFIIGHSDGTSDKAITPRKAAPGSFTISYANKASSYAGNDVFDPCALLPFSIVQAAVPGFPETITDNPGKRYTSPISIEHGYIDRDISQALGKDGQARSVSQTIGGTTNGTTMDNFTSLLDAKCAYGQGQPMSTTFARLFVIQKPTSFAPEFLPFLATLPKRQVNNVDMYAVNTPDSNGFMYVALVRPDQKVAVIIKGGIPALLATATEEISKNMTTAPKGHTQFTYPGLYYDLTDPCSLLPASAFEQYIKKPASALAEETLLLTDSQKLGVERTCQRLQADRTGDVGSIGSSTVTLRQGRTDEAAIAYLETLQQDFTVTSPDTKIGDQSLIRVKKSGSSPERSYAYVIRKGASVIELQIAPNDDGDASAKAFEKRIKPVAQGVYKQFLGQIK